MGTGGEAQYQDVAEAISGALAQIRRDGFTIMPDATYKLSDIIKRAYQLMLASDFGTLSPASPQRQQQLDNAETTLTNFIDTWMEIERQRNATELTASGFDRAYLKCPRFYPCPPS